MLHADTGCLSLSISISGLRLCCLFFVDDGALMIVALLPSLATVFFHVAPADGEELFLNTMLLKKMPEPTDGHLIRHLVQADLGKPPDRTESSTAA